VWIARAVYPMTWAQAKALLGGGGLRQGFRNVKLPHAEGYARRGGEIVAPSSRNSNCWPPKIWKGAVAGSGITRHASI